MEDDLTARASITVEAAVDRVWHALVDPAAIQAYMFGTTVVSDWREGGPIVWRGVWEGKPYQDKGTILKLRPNHTLSFTHFSPVSGLPDTPANYHTVTIELAAEGPRTNVVLTQDNNTTAEERDHSAGNWRSVLEGMKKLVEASG